MWTTDGIVVRALVGASILFPFLWASAFALGLDRIVAARVQQWAEVRRARSKIVPIRDRVA